MASQKFSPGVDNDIGAMRHKEALSAGATSDPVLIGARFRNVSYGLANISGGSGGKLQFTLDTVAEVEAGTAQYIDWASGDVTASTAEALAGPVTAVRAVMTTGATAEWYVIADTNR